MNLACCFRTKPVVAVALLTGTLALGGEAFGQKPVRPIVLPWAGVAPNSLEAALAASDSAMLPKTVAGLTSAGLPMPSEAPKPAPGAKQMVASTKDAATPVPAGTGVKVTGSSAMDGNFMVPLPDEKVLHLGVGHSAFIDTRHRLSRVYITNPDVLNSYTSSPNQVVVTTKAPGTSNLILWDESGDQQVYLISSESNLDVLSTALKRAFPMENIEVLGSDGRITITGTVGKQATADAVMKLAAVYGKDILNALYVSASKVKQVRLRVRFDEVDRSRISQFGFNLFSIFNGNGGNPTLVTTTTGAFPSTPQIGIGGATSSASGSSTTVAGSTVSVSNSLNFLIYNFSHNIGATIQDLESRNIARILAEPTITAMSGEKANFLAGGEFPFPIVQGGTAGTAAAVSIEFKPYGVKLEFTPIVNQDGSIDLTVAPEVSALDYTNAVSISGYTIPALSTRRAQTRITLRDGQTFAMTGLLDQRTTDALGRTPGIASVPILGALFKSKNITHSNTELLVMVTPEVVDPVNGPVEENRGPNSPIPLLNQQKFDEALPAGAKKPSANK
jgi:pilus assembly protein CpaC